MLEVKAFVDIDRPPAEVFAYLADMSNNPKWQRGMKSCTWTSEPPLQLGSTYDQEASFLGKKIVSSFEVVEYSEGSRIRIKTTGGTMPIDVIRTVEANADGSSSVGAIVRGDSSGVFKIAAPLMKMMVGASVRKDYAKLKSILEAG